MKRGFAFLYLSLVVFCFVISVLLYREEISHLAADVVWVFGHLQGKGSVDRLFDDAMSALTGFTWGGSIFAIGAVFVADPSYEKILLADVKPSNPVAVKTDASFWSYLQDLQFEPLHPKTSTQVGDSEDVQPTQKVETESVAESDESGSVTVNAEQEVVSHEWKIYRSKAKSGTTDIRLKKVGASSKEWVSMFYLLESGAVDHLRDRFNAKNLNLLIGKCFAAPTEDPVEAISYLEVC